MEEKLQDANEQLQQLRKRRCSSEHDQTTLLPLLAGCGSNFGQRSGGLEGLVQGGSRRREVGDAASDAFLKAMESVVPGDLEGIFRELMRKPSFRGRFLPPEWRDGLTNASAQKQVMDSKFLGSFTRI